MTMASAPNWAEQVTAIATAVLALGLVGAVAAAVVGAQQVSETRRGRQAQMAAEFIRRWNEEPLVQARQLLARFDEHKDLTAAFGRYVAEEAPEAYVLYRELDYFEQLAALERFGALDFSLIKLLVGRTLVDRWQLWEPALDAVLGEEVYPLFRDLARRMRIALDGQAAVAGPAGEPHS
jgi:hypothetical protein